MLGCSKSGDTKRIIKTFNCVIILWLNMTKVLEASPEPSQELPYHRNKTIKDIPDKKMFKSGHPTAGAGCASEGITITQCVPF